MPATPPRPGPPGPIGPPGPPGVTSTVLVEYEYPGGFPAGGAQQQFHYDYWSFPGEIVLLRDEAGAIANIELTEGVWQISAGVTVLAPQGSAAYGSLGIAIEPPPDPATIVQNDGGWAVIGGAERILATDFEFWPDNPQFDNLAAILLFNAPYVVPVGETHYAVIVVGTDLQAAVITARQQHQADQYIRAVRIP